MVIGRSTEDIAFGRLVLWSGAKNTLNASGKKYHMTQNSKMFRYVCKEWSFAHLMV